MPEDWALQAEGMTRIIWGKWNKFRTPIPGSADCYRLRWLLHVPIAILIPAFETGPEEVRSKSQNVS